MKKYLIIGLLLFVPFFAKAQTLYGFLDGQFYDNTGTLKAVCFLDNNCYDPQENFLGTKDRLLEIPTDTSYMPQATNFMEPTQQNQPTQSSNTLMGGESTTSPISIQADPNLTSISKTGIQQVLGQWVISNNTNQDIRIHSATLTFNFTGNPTQSEGFKNTYFLFNNATVGGTIPSLANIYVSDGGGFLFAIPANSSITFKIITDSVFNADTSITSMQPELNLDSSIGSFTSSNSLTIQ